MLSHKILVRKDIGRAASYYEDSADDYYSKDGKSSEWQGKGAKILKLSGAVDSADFQRLLSGDAAPINTKDNIHINNTSNLNNTSNTRNSTRVDSNQRIGIDLTFSAPKSVSIQALVAKDYNIIKAHNKAVKQAIAAAEQKAQARKKVKGKTYVETTGKLIVAKFCHETSREQDPQLHTHAIVMNLTQRSDGEWRALKNDEIIKMTRYLGAVYRAELASELQKIGYVIRHERGGMFELAHISREQLEKFSKRSMQIEQILAEQGLTREKASAKQKQQATMQSRKYKKAVNREELFAEWQSRAKNTGIVLEIPNLERENIQDNSKEKTLEEKNDKIKEAAKKTSANNDQHILRKVIKEEAAKRAVRFAVNHLTERQSVMTERMLLDKAISQAVGTTANIHDIENEIRKQARAGYLIRGEELYVPAQQIGIDKEPGKSRVEWINELRSNKRESADANEKGLEINQIAKTEQSKNLSGKGMNKIKATNYVRAAIKAGRLIKQEANYTTQTAISREKYILQSELKGRNIFKPIITEEIAKTYLAGSDLNKGQTEAAKTIVTTTNRIIGIQGFAGTGKSHMLKAAKTIIEKEGYNIRALAPYGTQVKVLAELGVKSNTLASFLRSKDKDINNRTIIVIDEAGVIPTRLMEQTIKLAEKAEARIVLIGDIAQTKAIEAGKPFEQLQKAGMITIHMDQIQRQKNVTLKEAVELAAKGNVEKSLENISDVIEIEDDKKRREAVAEAYMKLPNEERANTIIVSGTNEARRDINFTVRNGLDLSGWGMEVNTLIKRDITKAESKYAKHYHIGDIIQPEKDYIKTGLKRNEYYTIESTGVGSNNRLTVRDKAGKQFTFNPMTHQKLSVYSSDIIEVSTGDLMRITKNDSKLDVINGDRMKVKKIQSDYITLIDSNSGKELKLPTNKPLHLDYAYATTVHSSQGLTCDRVLIDADAKSLTTAKDVYYVAISRARNKAIIYTDNIEKLPKAISRDREKATALDMMRDRSYGY